MEALLATVIAAKFWSILGINTRPNIRCGFSAFVSLILQPWIWCMNVRGGQHVDCLHEEHLGRSIALACQPILRLWIFAYRGRPQMTTSRSNYQRGYYYKDHYRRYIVNIAVQEGPILVSSVCYKPMVPFRYTSPIPYHPMTRGICRPMENPD